MIRFRPASDNHRKGGDRCERVRHDDVSRRRKEHERCQHPTPQPAIRQRDRLGAITFHQPTSFRQKHGQPQARPRNPVQPDHAQRGVMSAAIAIAFPARFQEALKMLADQKVVQEANKEQFKSLDTRFFPYSAVEELYSLCERRKLRGITEEFLDSFMEPVVTNI